MKNQIYLNYLNDLKRKIYQKNSLIQVLMGPRQVGKTSSVQMLIHDLFAQNALYVSAEKLFHFNDQWLIECWAKAQAQNKILFIDEVQKYPQWAEVLKDLYDKSKLEQTPVHCVLLVASSYQAQQQLMQNLMGRYQLTLANQWNFNESKRAYSMTFEDYLKFGGYPITYPMIRSPMVRSKDWSDFVKHSIVATAFEKDILPLQIIKNPTLFRQSFELLCSHAAQEVSYTQLLGKLQNRGNVEVIKYYIKLLEGAHLFKCLEKYNGDIIKTKASSPKVLPLATCFFQLSVQDHYLPEERARAFELTVGQQLLRTNESVYYWREGTKSVDYVLKKGRNLWAIEVRTDIKALDHKKRQGLEAFCRRFPQARPVLINEQNYFEFEIDPLSYLEKKGTSHFRDEIPTIGTLESCDKPGSVKSPPVPEGLPDDHSSGPKISLRL